MGLSSLLLQSSLAIAFLLVGFGALVGSFCLSLAPRDGVWFQRSGSLLVLSSILVDIQQAMIKQPLLEESGTTTISGGLDGLEHPITAMTKWLHRISWVGIFIGTGIW